MTSEVVRCGAVERERHYTLRVYWRDGAVLHSSRLLEHQGWLGSGHGICNLYTLIPLTTTPLELELTHAHTDCEGVAANGVHV